VILALVIMSGILGSLMHLDPTTLPGQIGYFLAGLLLADLFLAAKRRKQDWRWDVVSLLGWPVVFLGPQAGIQLWLPCLTILLYIAAYHGLVLPRFLGNAWIAVTGGMCYTIYLWHASMISIVERVIARLPLAGTHNYFALLVIRLVLDLPLIAGTSLLLYILVERPCMDPQWPRKLGGFLKQARWPLIRSRRPVIFPS